MTFDNLILSNIAKHVAYEDLPNLIKANGKPLYDFLCVSRHIIELDATDKNMVFEIGITMKDRTMILLKIDDLFSPTMDYQIDEYPYFLQHYQTLIDASFSPGTHTHTKAELSSPIYWEMEPLYSDIVRGYPHAVLIVSNDRFKFLYGLAGLLQLVKDGEIRLESYVRINFPKSCVDVDPHAFFTVKISSTHVLPSCGIIDKDVTQDYDTNLPQKWVVMEVDPVKFIFVSLEQC